MDYELAKDLAETIAGLHRKMDEVYNVTGWEIFETFPEADTLYYLFLRMVDGVADDFSRDIFVEYIAGDITFDVLVSEVRDGEKH